MKRLTFCALAILIAKADVESLNSLDDDGSMMDQMDAPAPPPTIHVDLKKVPFKAPTTPNSAFFETFQFEEASPTEGGWTLSEVVEGKWEVSTHPDEVIMGDKALKVKSPLQYHAIAKKLGGRVSLDKDEIWGTIEVQYENEVTCGGAYFKLFDSSKAAGGESSENPLAKFDGKTPYSIMFGPDRCGFSANKVHLILKYAHPKEEGKLMEAHATNVPQLPSTLPFGSHQYGFRLGRDGKYAMYVDGKEVRSGQIVDDFTGQDGLTNEEEIDDPSDVKPADWDDRKQIEDPDAVKPDDWDEDAPAEVPDMDAIMPDAWEEDEPLTVPNPDAQKPEDWNDDEDGEWIRPSMKNPKCKVGCGPWIRPMKPNPEYKGPWQKPLIENPNYKGIWAPRKIPNPSHYQITDPWKTIQPFDSIGLELWVVETGATFDNILITNSAEEYHQFVKETWMVKHDVEEENQKRRTEAEQKSMQDSKETKQASGYFDKLMKLMPADSRVTLLLLIVVPALSAVYMISSYFKQKRHAAVAHKKDDEKRTKDDAVRKDSKSDSKADTNSDAKEAKAGDSKAEKTADTKEEVRQRKGSRS